MPHRRWRSAALTLTLALLPALTGVADTVDDLSSALDRIESRFWLALPKHPTAPDRHDMRDRLMAFTVMAGDLQRFQQKFNIRVSCNVAAEARALQNLFNDTRYTLAQGYRFDFKPTRLEEYRQAVARSRGRGKNSEPPPTLATLDLEHYRTWLEDLQTANRASFNRGKGKRSSAQDAEIRNVCDRYFTSCLKLRIALAEIRQEANRRELELP